MVIISYKKTSEIDFRNFLINTDSIIIQKHPEKNVSHFLTRDYMHILENEDDTYYVGNIKGVGHIYQQTFIDTYSKVAFAKLYDRKNALIAADTLN